MKGLSESASKAGGAPPPTLSSSTECAATPPSLNGTCDAACLFLKIAEAGAEAVLGEVPIFGNFLADLTGVFWPSSSDDEYTILQDTLQYIDSKIADATSEIFLSDIQKDYRNLVSNAQTLETHIQENYTSTSRESLLDTEILNGDCTNLNSAIIIDGPQINPISLLAAVGNIGQSCLAMRTAWIYHYNSTVGGTPPSMTGSKVKLDKWVQFYTDAAQNASQRALAWRMSQIESPTSPCGAGGTCGRSGGAGHAL